MALRDRSYEEAFDTSTPVWPLPTGFEYRPRSEIDDFEVPAEDAAEVAHRLDRVDRYHRQLDVRIEGWFAD